MKVLAILALLAAGQAPAEISRGKFDALKATIKPEPGKQHLWMEIPWEISIQKARERAAREDKPLFLFRAANGHPLGHS
jgi:hypothetical protein